MAIDSKSEEGVICEDIQIITRFASHNYYCFFRNNIGSFILKLKHIAWHLKIVLLLIVKSASVKKVC